jgi:hypothetical protein
MTAVYVGAALAELELRIGRQLTAAERHVRVEEIDTLLNTAKAQLIREIEVEQEKLAATIADGGTGTLAPTPRMRAILRGLRDHGRQHALLELASMGYLTVTRGGDTRRYDAPKRKARKPADNLAAVDAAAAAEQAANQRIAALEGSLQHGLAQLTVKIEQQAVGVDLSTVATSAIHKAVVNVLGARSIAASLVAPAFDAGLGWTFDEHADLVDGWQYSAILDGGTCDPCADEDGETFESWDAIQDVLPGGGPNPDCDGGDRCRCRAVPMPPGG